MSSYNCINSRYFLNYTFCWFIMNAFEKAVDRAIVGDQMGVQIAREYLTAR